MARTAKTVTIQRRFVRKQSDRSRVCWIDLGARSTPPLKNLSAGLTLVQAEPLLMRVLRCVCRLRLVDAKKQLCSCQATNSSTAQRHRDVEFANGRDEA